MEVPSTETEKAVSGERGGWEEQSFSLEHGKFEISINIRHLRGCGYKIYCSKKNTVLPSEHHAGWFNSRIILTLCNHTWSPHYIKD